MSPPDLRSVLLDALEDERKAEATYKAVIAKFGPVRPFINIVEAEQRHAGAIERQLHRLGFPVPENHWSVNVVPPASIVAACELAVQAEIENIALYDKLIPMISDPIVRGVFENLQAASRDNHLPAFRRCLARDGAGGGDGGGRGRGRGGGRQGRGGGCRS